MICVTRHTLCVSVEAPEAKISETISWDLRKVHALGGKTYVATFRNTLIQFDVLESPAGLHFGIEAFIPSLLLSVFSGDRFILALDGRLFQKFRVLAYTNSPTSGVDRIAADVCVLQVGSDDYGALSALYNELDRALDVARLLIPNARNYVYHNEVAGNYFRGIP